MKLVRVKPYNLYGKDILHSMKYKHLIVACSGHVHPVAQITINSAELGEVKANRQPKVLLCSRLWWASSARLALAFLRAGCRVSAVCPPSHPLRHVTGLDSLHSYANLDPAGSLRNAILASGAELVVPCDDAAVWHLHQLHNRYPEMRRLIEYSLGAKESFSIVQSRGDMLDAAASLGIRVPLTQTVISEEDLNNWPLDGQAVVKLDGTWGGAGVAIVDSHAKAVAEFRRLSGPIRSGVAWKRWLINRHPRALMSWRRRREKGLTIQQFVQGRPANTMAACWQGEVLAAVSVEVLASQGPTGAAIVVRLVKNEEIERATRLLARKLMFNGFIGLDFILEDKTGDAYLIELNPRSTQLGHLRLPGQGDLASALVARIKGEIPTVPPDCIENPIIALFPQTLNWDPGSVYLTSGHHDMPLEEPALCRELLQDSWPDRHWLSRAYQYLRMPKREKMAKWS
jgi:hypothetical protein